MTTLTLIGRSNERANARTERVLFEVLMFGAFRKLLNQ